MTAPSLPHIHTPTVQLRTDGIMCIDYGHNPNLSGEGLAEVLRRRREISQLAMPVLVKVTGRPSIDSQLPKALRSSDYCSITTAVAYVTDSWHVRNLINTYLTVQKPPYPLFIFDTEEEALICLRRYVQGDPAI